MSELTANQVVAWLRATAEEFDRTADWLECRPTAQRHTSAPEVRSKLAEHSWRVKELAADLKVSEAEIEAIVSNPENGFVRKKRGWIFDSQAERENDETSLSSPEHTPD